jgi:hypothetical protein
MTARRRGPANLLRDAGANWVPSAERLNGVSLELRRLTSTPHLPGLRAADAELVRAPAALPGRLPRRCAVHESRNSLDFLALLI